MATMAATSSTVDSQSSDLDHFGVNSSVSGAISPLRDDANRNNKNNNNNMSLPRSSDDHGNLPASNASGGLTLGPEAFIESYTIAWVCALQEEYQAACHMLDVDDFPTPRDMETNVNDRNHYVFGQLGEHYVVVGCLPMGQTGTINAANVATDMIRSFPNLKFGLMVGIGGGAPLGKKRDIRLGDVVVGTRVVQLDFGARLANGLFQRRGQLDNPPKALLATAQEIQRLLDDPRKPDSIAEHIKRMSHMQAYRQPTRDRLFKSKYLHRNTPVEPQSSPESDDEVEDWEQDEDEDGCRYCDEKKVVPRHERDKLRQVTVHHGPIASDNVVMKDAEARNRHAKDDTLKIHCFEMEAAGLQSLPCLAIRGICDYADSHKNDEWHNYAALVAAAYARELLLKLRKQTVLTMPSWAAQINERLESIQEQQKAHSMTLSNEAQKAEEARLKRSLVSLKSGINPADSMSSDDSYRRAHDDRLKGTCEWLFDREKFRDWTAKNPRKSVFWLHGKHGSGKSVLCAAAMDYLSLARTMSKSGLEDTKHTSSDTACPLVIRQFLSKDQYMSERQLLGNIAMQLVDALIDSANRGHLKSIPNSLLRFQDRSNADVDKLQNLLGSILEEVPLTYIFVDGLDEAEYTEDPISNRTDQPSNAIKNFVDFLANKAYESPQRVRVWLSSQPLHHIREHLTNQKWSAAICELKLEKEDTKKDIEDFLDYNMPNSAGTHKELIMQILKEAVLKNEVEGSFLWSSAMMKELQSDLVEDDDDIIKSLREGLPLEMKKIYRKVMDRIIKNDIGTKKPPLWKIVLSVLTFAKRPLKMTEMREAIGILRTESGHNLRTDMAKEERILKSCLSLVRHNPEMSGQHNVGLLRLSHSAVRSFLLAQDDEQTDKGEPLVDIRIIGDSCMKYLNQKKYQIPLERNSTGGFSASDRSDVLSHHFLLYSAKYWYQHYDAAVQSSGNTYGEKHRYETLAFLRSTKFLTCMQVQSLFVQGHFLQDFHDITNHGTSIKPTLPLWIRNHEPELYKQYQIFQGEWCRLLQAKPSDTFYGSLGRCLWGALGNRHFLSSHSSSDKRLCQYISFEFNQGEGNFQVGDSGQVHHVSEDGSLLWTAWIRTLGHERTVILEQWKLDKREGASLELSIAIPFSDSGTSIERYNLPSTEAFYAMPFLPKIESTAPPHALAIHLHGSLIRIGSKLFRKVSSHSSANTTAQYHETLDQHPTHSWEEVCNREPFIVVSRRRKYSAQPVDKDKEDRRVQRMKRRMSRYDERSRSRSRTNSPFSRHRLRSIWKALSRSPSRPSHFPARSSPRGLRPPPMEYPNPPWTRADDSSSDYSSDSVDFRSDSSISSELLDLSPAEESWSDNISSEEDSSSDEIEDPQSSEPSESGLDIVTENESSDHTIDSDFEIKSSADLHSDDSQDFVMDQLSDSSDSTVDYIASEIDDSPDDSSEDEVANLEAAPLNPKPEGPVKITEPRLNITCDHCSKPCSQQHYHCAICRDDDFDLCQTCKRRGIWCLDLKHHLYRRMGRKPVDVVYRRDFSARQELVVYKTDSNGAASAIFHFQKKYPVFLYESPPVIHKTFDLVVWALSDSRLLFGDISQNKWFEQKITTPGKHKAHPICVSLSFSPSGNLLRMAIIDGVAEKLTSKRKSKDANPGGAAKARLCLNLHVLILQLSASHPARHPPKLLATETFRLGCSCTRSFVSTVPFAFTWTTSELYLTMSDSVLQVFKVVFPDLEGQTGKTSALQSQPAAKSEPRKQQAPRFKILVPKETILLPRSSRNRSVQFYPATTGDKEKATVIVGPRLGHNASPPIGVYLDATDLGGWVEHDLSREDGPARRLERSFDGQFEESWDDDDCILIPFDY